MVHDTNSKSKRLSKIWCAIIIVCVAFLALNILGFGGYSLPTGNFLYGYDFGDSHWFSVYRVTDVFFSAGCIWQTGKLFADCDQEFISCKQFNGQPNQLGIISFVIPASPLAASRQTVSRYVYVSSQDSGESWQSFMSSEGWLASPTCFDMSFYDEDLLWVSHQGLLAISSDGGQSWDFWNSSMIQPPLEQIWSPGFIKIDEIRFVTRKQGIMQLSRYMFGRDKPIIQLETTDGGLTWQISEWS
jgi:hypothetical protein